MPAFVDQTGNTIFLENIPSSIVSVVPSQTELLYSLGLSSQVTGITKFCVHPDHWFRSKTRVGGTKNLNIGTIRKINPDLVIANKEENSKNDIEALSKEFPVWISDIGDLESACEMIQLIGIIVGREKESSFLLHDIRERFEILSDHLMQLSKPLTAVYLIWPDPYMTVGGDTFIHDMIEKAGFINIYKNKNRYPVVTMEELQQQKPDIILLSSEPYPFKEEHIAGIQSCLPQTKFLIVDGEMFSWYGSRMQKAPSYFMEIMKKCGRVV